MTNALKEQNFGAFSPAAGNTISGGKSPDKRYPWCEGAFSLVYPRYHCNVARAPRATALLATQNGLAVPVRKQSSSGKGPAPGHPVQIRKSPWGWPHQHARGTRKPRHADPRERGDLSPKPAAAGRGGLWVIFSMLRNPA